MCQICDNDYSNTITNLYISNCVNVSAIPRLTFVKVLILFNCPNIEFIEMMDNLLILSIIHNNKLMHIPNYPRLSNLYLDNCNKITHLPILSSVTLLSLNNICISSIYLNHNLLRLSFFNCNILRTIKYNYFKFNVDTSILRCNYLHDYRSSINILYSIDKYLLILKITNWYKRMKFLKSNRMCVLWQIGEYYISKKYAPNNILNYVNLA